MRRQDSGGETAVRWSNVKNYIHCRRVHSVVLWNSDSFDVFWFDSGLAFWPQCSLTFTVKNRGYSQCQGLWGWIIYSTYYVLWSDLSVGIIKAFILHSEGNIKVWTTFYSSPSNSCGNISLKTTIFNLKVALEVKSRIMKVILWAPWYQSSQRRDARRVRFVHLWLWIMQL